MPQSERADHSRYQWTRRISDCDVAESDAFLKLRYRSCLRGPSPSLAPLTLWLVVERRCPRGAWRPYLGLRSPPRSGRRVRRAARTSHDVFGELLSEIYPFQQRIQSGTQRLPPVREA